MTRLVRQAVYKGPITRLQLNEGFMYRMETSSSSHLRTIVLAFSLHFQLNAINIAVDKSFMHFSLVHIHCLHLIQPGIYILILIHARLKDYTG